MTGSAPTSWEAITWSMASSKAASRAALRWRWWAGLPPAVGDHSLVPGTCRIHDEVPSGPRSARSTRGHRSAAHHRRDRGDPVHDAVGQVGTVQQQVVPTRADVAQRGVERVVGDAAERVEERRPPLVAPGTDRVHEPSTQVATKTERPLQKRREQPVPDGGGVQAPRGGVRDRTGEVQRDQAVRDDGQALPSQAHRLPRGAQRRDSPDHRGLHAGRGDRRQRCAGHQVGVHTQRPTAVAMLASSSATSPEIRASCRRSSTRAWTPPVPPRAVSSSLTGVPPQPLRLGTATRPTSARLSAWTSAAQTVARSTGDHRSWSAVAAPTCHYRRPSPRSCAWATPAGPVIITVPRAVTSPSTTTSSSGAGNPLPSPSVTDSVAEPHPRGRAAPAPTPRPAAGRRAGLHGPGQLLPPPASPRRDPPDLSQAGRQVGFLVQPFGLRDRGDLHPARLRDPRAFRSIRAFQEHPGVRGDPGPMSTTCWESPRCRRCVRRLPMEEMTTAMCTVQRNGMLAVA